MTSFMCVNGCSRKQPTECPTIIGAADFRATFKRLETCWIAPRPVPPFGLVFYGEKVDLSRRDGVSVGLKIFVLYVTQLILILSFSLRVEKSIFIYSLGDLCDAGVIYTLISLRVGVYFFQISDVSMFNLDEFRSLLGEVFRLPITLIIC